MSPFSLVVSTYNASAFLRLCLQSILRQTALPYEVIIADDGSTDDTPSVIESFKAKAPFPVIHVWQKNEGFRLAQMRNKAFAKVSTDYIVQIDGDIILHPKFTSDHLYLREKNYFVTGSRVLLSPETTKHLVEDNSIGASSYVLNGENHFNSLRSRPLSLFLSRLYKQKGGSKYYVKGCNMAFWKDDIIRVNGYNEDFVGWGQEDSEIAIRLMNSGIKKKFLKMGGVAYHLYHPFAPRDKEKAHLDMMQKVIDEKICRTDNGINKYL